MIVCICSVINKPLSSCRFHSRTCRRVTSSKNCSLLLFGGISIFSSTSDNCFCHAAIFRLSPAVKGRPIFTALARKLAIRPLISSFLSWARKNSAAARVAAICSPRYSSSNRSISPVSLRSSCNFAWYMYQSSRLSATSGCSFLKSSQRRNSSSLVSRGICPSQSGSAKPSKKFSLILLTAISGSSGWSLRLDTLMRSTCGAASCSKSCRSPMAAVRQSDLTACILSRRPVINSTTPSTVRSAASGA